MNRKPSVLVQSEDWTPKESFSPSAMGTFNLCPRKWAYSYGFGLWSKGKGIGPMLGSIIHLCLESYLKGGTIHDFVIDKRTLLELESFTQDEQALILREAPKRAFMSLPLLPRVDECEIAEVEVWLDIDTRLIVPEIEPLKIPGKIDLRFRRAGYWYVIDHKSTKDFKYMKTEADLTNDPQGVFYPLDTILKHDLPGLWNRWSYCLTDPKERPEARPLDVHFDREGRIAAAVPWVRLADVMRQWVRAIKAGSATIDDVTFPTQPEDPEESPCKAFGGCPYHEDRGGPCRPPTKPAGQLIMASALTAHIEPEETETKATPMDLKSLVTSAGGNLPAQPPAAPPAAAPAAPAPAPPPQATAPVVADPPNVPQSPLLPPEAHQPAPAPTAPAAAPAAPTPQPPPAAPQPAPVAPVADAPPAAPEKPKGAGRPRKSKSDKALAALQKAQEKYAAACEADGVEVTPTGIVIPNTSTPEPVGFTTAAVKATVDVELEGGTVIRLATTDPQHLAVFTDLARSAL